MKKIHNPSRKLQTVLIKLLEIKDEFREFGWENYDDYSVEKTDWWRN